MFIINYKIHYHFYLQTKLDQIRQRQQMMSVPRNVSASNIDLNQSYLHQQPQMNNPWSTTPMQQAQSMAQLNINPRMQWQQQPQQQQQTQHWTNNFEVPHMNGSNMSLNLPPTGYFYPPDNRPPPPVWMNQNWGAPQMYPYPVGMVPMTPLIAHSRSRGPSRNQSRAASPSQSVKSRRSMISSRHHRSSYNQDLTDDEDSDLSDRDFGSRSNRGGSRKNSHSQKNSTLTRRSNRNSQDFDNASDRERHFLKKRSSRTESEIIASSRRSPSPIDLRRSPELSSSFEKSPPIKKEIQHPAAPVKKIQPAAPIKKIQPAAAPVKGPEPIKQTVAEVKAAAPKSNRIASKAEFEAELKVNVVPIKKSLVQEKPQSSSSEEEDVDDNEEEVEEEEEEIEEYKENFEKPDEPQLGNTHLTVYPDTIEEDDLGPPPSAPDHEWECEHCTYVNEPNVQICLICCKTPTQKPKPTSILKQTTSSTDKKTAIKPNNQSSLPKILASEKKSPPTDIDVSGSHKTTVKIVKSSGNISSNAAPLKLKLKNSTVESVKSKFENAATPKMPTLKTAATTTSEESSSEAGKMKGRTLRKISFWPGTKTK